MKSKRIKKKSYRKKSYNKKTLRKKSYNKKTLRKKSYKKQSYRRIRNKIYIGGNKLRSLGQSICYLTQESMCQDDYSIYYNDFYVNQAISNINKFIENFLHYKYKENDPVNHRFILLNSTEFRNKKFTQAEDTSEVLNEHSLRFLTNYSSHDNNIIKKLNRLINLLETKRDIINSTIIFFLYNINLENANTKFNDNMMNIVYSKYINTYIYICKLVIIKHFCYNIKKEYSYLDKNTDIENILNIINTSLANKTIIKFFYDYKKLFNQNKINIVLYTSFELTAVFNFFKNILEYILTGIEDILLYSRIDNLISFLHNFNGNTLIKYKCEYIIYRIITIPLYNQRFLKSIENLQKNIFTAEKLEQLLTNEHFFELFHEDTHNIFEDQKIVICAYYYKSLIYIINNFIVNNYYDFAIEYQTKLANQNGGTQLSHIIRKRQLNEKIREIEREREKLNEKLNEKIREIEREREKLNEKLNIKKSLLEEEIKSLEKSQMETKNITTNILLGFILELLNIIDAYKFFKSYKNESYNVIKENWDRMDDSKKINLRNEYKMNKNDPELD